MKLLLDTQILLWAAIEPRRIASKTRELLEDPANQLVFSAASIWEVAIKRALGRDDFRVDPHRLWRGLVENGYVDMEVASRHTLALERLPSLHRDPFDRILLAQADVEGLTLVTADPVLMKYPVKVIEVRAARRMRGRST